MFTFNIGLRKENYKFIKKRGNESDDEAF